ncbi:MAG: M20 family metallo-hydrolase [Bacteroidaceae bacterium]|nr:M20 family metallo-hydrolase [Bacteroidaceae bacterium]
MQIPHKYIQQAIELLHLLISTPSFSREESEAADKLHMFIHRGAPFKVDIHRHLNNIWCISPDFDPQRPTLLLDAHIDTVKPVADWKSQPFTPITDGDKIIGLGSNDDGGSLVTMLQLFYILCQERQSYNIIFLASAEEEVSGKNGIEAVIPLLPPISCAIIGEPTGLQPAIAEKGLMVLDCTVHGIAGHAARNNGKNAIYEAMNDIEWLRNHRFEKISPILGSVNINVTQINAGTQHNVIPDICTFVTDVRSNECYSNAELLDIISQGVKGEVVPRSLRLNSSSISTEHPLVKRALELNLKPFGSPTLSNQALLAFPTLKMGPGDSTRSHTANEYICISEITEGISTFVAMLNGLKLN